MSAFTPKRKARVIKIDDEEELGQQQASPAEKDGVHQVTVPVKFMRKPFRQSGLRKSINVSEDEDGGGGPTALGESGEQKVRVKQPDEDDGGPVVIRPAMSRSGSTKQKKRASTSRLSFGPGAEDGDGGEVTTPRKATLAKQVLESSASRNPGLSLRFGEDDSRPRYSKEYLDELQSSTPNTPRDLASLHITDDEDMGLDASELEGALIVDDGRSHDTTILTSTEIQERKDRRARLAREKDFISLDGDDEDGGVRLRKNKTETRMVAEDEDIGEGFDEFVEDGGISLGRKAERAARLRQRQEMAQRIQQAEGNSEEESDDSEAERRAAFEAAQTRAGMDGLQKVGGQAEQVLQVPPKITPLPTLGACLQRLQATLASMEQELAAKEKRVEVLRGEKAGILAREAEVQQLLNEAGQKYMAATGGAQSPGRQLQGASMGELAAERGLESFGTTPNERHSMEEE